IGLRRRSSTGMAHSLLHINPRTSTPLGRMSYIVSLPDRAVSVNSTARPAAAELAQIQPLMPATAALVDALRWVASRKEAGGLRLHPGREAREPGQAVVDGRWRQPLLPKRPLHTPLCAGGPLSSKR